MNYHKWPLSQLPHDLKRQLWRRTNRRERARYDALRAGRLAPCDNLNCIFVHVPKTAGVSVCKALFGNLGGGHTAIKKYELIYPKEEFRQRFKFTFVRNPWDRVVSAFYFLKEGGFGDEDSGWLQQHIDVYPDFDSFVVNGLATREIQEKLHFRPQVRFLRNDRDEIPLDFIGRFENLATDLGKISDHLGVTAKLEHTNKTEGRSSLSYRGSYNEQTREIVRDLYRDDIETFAYAF